MRERNQTWPLRLIKLMFLISVFVTSLWTSDAAWTMVDFSLGIMTWINILVLLF
ncbi:alanine:cation symporter family protein [Siminovitchia sediminis]|uniref:Alanine:cation symporter family protein n=1 Tax=Siminovitchia sediminis TaxID=1274353 RepID=A0ABW4KLZ3_9BACI